MLFRSVVSMPARGAPERGRGPVVLWTAFSVLTGALALRIARRAQPAREATP